MWAAHLGVGLWVAYQGIDLTRSNQCLVPPPFSPGDQDFYSHSNWVELGEQRPYSDLLWPRRELWSLAQGTAMIQSGDGSSGSLLFLMCPLLCHLLESQDEMGLYPCKDYELLQQLTATRVLWLSQPHTGKASRLSSDLTPVLHLACSTTRASLLSEPPCAPNSLGAVSCLLWDGSLSQRAESQRIGTHTCGLCTPVRLRHPNGDPEF